MQEGSFYCFVPKFLPGIGSWLSRTKSEKLVYQKLDTVISSWEDDNPLGNSGTGNFSSGSLSGHASLPQTQCYAYRHAGLTVKLGLQEVASDLFRVKPYVYSAPDSSAVIIFSGCLKNLSELAARTASARWPRLADINNVAPLERKSSIERSMDIGSTAARTVLEMHLEGDQDEIMLSELQGEYAFIIYDNKKKQAFAARDPSGDEPLYYHIGEDGSVSFASSRLAVPDGEQPHDWTELPPGHYISGKVPKVHQFALTPQQLVMREIEEEDGTDVSLSISSSSRRRSLGLGAAEEAQLAAQLSHRTSLDNDHLLKHRSADNDLFALDL